MSKAAMLSNEAYARLTAHKRGKKESVSDIILRFVPPRIRTFGDLEQYLENTEGPIIDNWPALERLRKRKLKNAHAH
jgi:predicted CopG family antitoxin